MFNFETREGRQNFIANNDSSIYEGKNVDSEKVIVILEKGKVMDVKTQKHSKPKWFEVIEYDESGFKISISYEPV